MSNHPSPHLIKESSPNTPLCPGCGNPIDFCVCDDEDDDDFEDDYEGDEDDFSDEIDAFGRNFSDADPGL